MERGFSVPMEKTDVWAPVTPEKPVEQRPNHFPVGMQQNQKQDENWQDLLGIYTHFLQDQSCGVVGINPTEPPIQNISQNSSAGLDGVNHWNRGIQDVDKLRSFGQNCGKAGSYLQNLGDVVPPQQVSSLAELLGISGNTLNAPAMKASSISQDSRVESSWNNCIPDSMIVQNQEIGGSNLQQMPSSKQIFIDRLAISAFHFFALKL